ncbi:NAD dependent epimerase/dehydratase family protein-like protein [Lophiostoma macrostomum CBS 122681]|uniref:NAD dependent epimerase/dehydratase family protein-like protein n=1 Tax=Lophiostoma macrostomum CBS 122681 TaxID=1314788 RepID=A0A6A6TL47_9PLEO|nr:NAD dependent epimerase/dehydratase family protein-like protein [Lophiostoma macrostomum CBS 122681]
MPTQTVHSNGIYHGLPTYPPSRKTQNLTAIITGANGISGNYMLRVLAQAPERWSKIYCLSRRPPAIPEGLPKNAEHIACDFLRDSGEIAGVLRERGIGAQKGGKGEEGGVYVFFYSYVQVEPKSEGGKKGALWSDAEEMVRVNVALLKNFCEALPLAGIKAKRIMLQTGAKNYGVHLGPAATPQEEHHPRITLEPNFYYPQEDYLFDFCATHSITYNVCMPSFILGAVPDAAMNLVYPLGIYAAVTQHLHTPLDFPSDLQAWEATHVASSSKLNAYLEEWCVLSEHAANQRFNAADGGPFTWGAFWPRFASWYGLEYGRPDDDVHPDAYTITTTPYVPRGFGPPKSFRRKFSLVEWARQERVQKAWAEIVEENGLKVKKLQDMDVDRIFAFADGSLAGGTLDLSMNKARKMGWHGFVDTNECIREVLEEFVELGMLPKIG